MLDVVQSSIAEYEKLTGRQSDDRASSIASPTSFSGYTVALLEAVAKMSVYLKEVMSCTYLTCVFASACCSYSKKILCNYTAAAAPTTTTTTASASVYSAWAVVPPFLPFFIPCPFTSSSFALFYFFLFSFALPVFFFCPSLSFLPE